MEYACPPWYSSASAVDAHALERVQASLACTILAADWDTPKDILFRQLDWPSLRWRRTILSMTLFHQLVHHGEGPLMECMFQLSLATGRSVRKPHQLILGMASSTKRVNGFFYSAAILWNTLPAKIQDITNPRLFRASLEDCLSRQKYNPLSDALFQNFGHSPSLSPSLSLSLSIYIYSYLSLYLFIVSVSILLTATSMLTSLLHSQHHTSLLHSLAFTNTGITCSCISSTLFGDPLDQGKPIPCWGIPQILINKK